MTTVINTPPHRDTVDGGGWAVSVIVLVAVIGIGLFFWLNYGRTPSAENPDTTRDTSTNINVTLPDPTPDAPVADDTE